MAEIDGGIDNGEINGFIIHPCVSEISAFNMSLSKENRIKGLMEVTKKIEEGGEVDSNTRTIVEEFLNNFPPPTTTSRNLSDFPAFLALD